MTHRQIIECDKCKDVIPNNKSCLQWNVDIKEEDKLWIGQIHICKKCSLVLLKTCLQKMDVDNNTDKTLKFLKGHGINPEKL